MVVMVLCCYVEIVPFFILRWLINSNPQLGRQARASFCLVNLLEIGLHMRGIVGGGNAKRPVL